MGKLHAATVVQYKVGDRTIDVELCWKGEVADLDKDRFYDFYDENGALLNEASPWHDDDNGVPSYTEVAEAFGGE